MIKMIKAALALLAIAVTPLTTGATPQDAERFTKIAGIALSDLPSSELVQKSFGSSPVVEAGDAGTYIEHLCYRSADGKAAVEFFHGEVDWGYLIRKARANDNACPSSRKINNAALSIAGIELGMKESVYRTILGAPYKDVAGHLEHRFEYTHTLSDSELQLMVERNVANGYPPSNIEDLRKWNVSIDIRASFSSERLISFRVDRAETN